MRSDTTFAGHKDARLPRLAAGPKVRLRAADRPSLLCTFALVALALAPGCAAPARVPDPLTRGPLGKADDADVRSEFWYQLARRPAVSNDEAFHALLLYFAGPASAPADYAGRVAALQSRGMLPAGFDRPADEMVERGTVAVAVAEGAAVKGGVTARLLGPTPR